MILQRFITITGLLTAIAAMGAEPLQSPARPVAAEAVATAASSSDVWLEFERVEAANAKARDILSQKRGFDWHEVPFKDAVKELAEAITVPIRVDARTLEAAGVREDTPITLVVEPIWIRTAVTLARRGQRMIHRQDSIYWSTTQAFRALRSASSMRTPTVTHFGSRNGSWHANYIRDSQMSLSERSTATCPRLRYSSSGLPVSWSRRWRPSAAGMAKRGLHRVSEGHDACSERPAT